MIFGVVRSDRASVVAFAVGAFITSAFYFTSSTAFANPAVSIGRMFSDTFTGIDPGSVPAFLGAQAVGVLVAVPLIRFLFPDVEDVAHRVVVPHEE